MRNGLNDAVKKDLFVFSVGFNQSYYCSVENLLIHNDGHVMSC